MERFKKITGYTVFAIQVLLTFLLVVDERLEIPAWLQAFGRLHPMLLHLPIGLVIVTSLLIFTRKFFDGGSFDALTGFLLHLAALTTSFTALMGLLLSNEGGYNDSALELHKWFGVALSFLCWALISVRQNSIILKAALACGIILVVLAGHYGAALTHGENYVLGPLKRETVTVRTVTDSSSVFSATIQPIFEARCASCHNKEKAKGKLILTSQEAILRGGKNGALWTPGDAEQSLLVARLMLPVDHKEHMPPKDKTQLTEDELAFIQRWIASGADTEMKLVDLPTTDTLRKLSTSIISRYNNAGASVTSRYTFEFASQNKVQQLSTPYRSVFQIARTEPALAATFYLSHSYQKKYLEELAVVKDQLVSLNLSKMPVEDNDLQVVSQFINLEKLILNQTVVKGEGLRHLIGLEHLRQVSLSGSKVDAKALRALAANKNLSDVYLWDTGITEVEAEVLRKEFVHIRWQTGYRPDENETLRLSGPILKNDGQVLQLDEKIILKHNLPGAVIRYAFGTQALDSVDGPQYTEPLSVTGYTVLKTKAYKEGWLSSTPVEYIFFKKGHTPSRVELQTAPDKKFPGEGAPTLIDGRKGMPDFYRDPVWMAFRNEPLEAYFFFDGKAPTIRSITLSYARNVYSLCFAPAEMEVWGGANSQSMKLLKNINPGQPNDWVSTRIEGASVEIPPSTFACYKIVARPLSKPPAFREEKKEKGWLMVDEVFFN